MENNIFTNNRNRLGELLQDDSLLFVYSVEGANLLDFVVDKNFYYLTGIEESKDILVITKKQNKVSSILFISRPDELYAKWNGRKLTNEEAKNISGIERIMYLDEFEAFSNRLISTSSNVYLNFNPISDIETYSHSAYISKKIKEHFPYVNIKNAKPLFEDVRHVKMDEEIKNIRNACNITKEGLEEILKNIRPGIFEYQLESYFDQKIKFCGSKRHAFKTICASGRNACCLHYQKNDMPLQEGDLVLLDLGASYNNYHSDISRTFPISGKFTPRQKQLYNIVLEGQRRCIDFIKAGVTTKDINEHLIDYYKVVLKEIGLIKEDSEVSNYYYHGVSHHLGLDTHDPCGTKPLEEGAVITCEPGLYIEAEGIGIRIEDDVLVTKDKAIVLSSNIIKTVEEIEDFISKNKLYLK